MEEESKKNQIETSSSESEAEDDEINSPIQ